MNREEMTALQASMAERWTCFAATHLSRNTNQHRFRRREIIHNQQENVGGHHIGLDCYLSPAQTHGKQSESTYQQREPYLRNPRYGDEEQHVEVGERSRPMYRSPERGIVADIPQSECP